MTAELLKSTADKAEWLINFEYIMRWVGIGIGALILLVFILLLLFSLTCWIVGIIAEAIDNRKSKNKKEQANKKFREYKEQEAKYMNDELKKIFPGGTNEKDN